MKKPRKQTAQRQRVVVNLFELHNDCSGAWLEKFQSDFHAKNLKGKNNATERLRYLQASEKACQRALRLEKKIQQAAQQWQMVGEYHE